MNLYFVLKLSARGHFDLKFSEVNYVQKFFETNGYHRSVSITFNYLSCSCQVMPVVLNAGYTHVH